MACPLKQKLSKINLLHTGYSILSLSYLSFYKWKDVVHWTLQVKDELLQVYIFTSEPGQMLFMDSPLEYSFGYELWIWYSLFPLLSFKYEWMEIWNVNSHKCQRYVLAWLRLWSSILGYAKLDVPCGTDNQRTKYIFKFFCKSAELG